MLIDRLIRTRAAHFTAPTDARRRVPFPSSLPLLTRGQLASMHQIVEADLTWVNQRFQPAIQIEIADGRIVRVSQRVNGSRDHLTHSTCLKNQALLPGLVNAHSHAFQRALRGRTEVFHAFQEDTFWSWRQRMYDLVDSMDRDLFAATCVDTFSEMRRAGITTVGEFHYLHHCRHRDDFALDELVLRAAKAAGIRLVLLNAFYQQGHFDNPLDGTQLRFRTRSLKHYWRQMDRLAGLIDPDTQSLGAVAHSLRAVGIDEATLLQAEARRRGLVFHMHVEEQPAEQTDCLNRYGKTPMALLSERMGVDEGFTAVHCTHTRPRDLEGFLEAGGNICVCPLTEANLGDGVPDLKPLTSTAAMARGQVCLGTDSNSRISFLEEMRWLEYTQRLARLRRGVFVVGSGSNGRDLWSIATSNGARALNMPVGEIAPGRYADLIVVDLKNPRLAGWSPDNLIDIIVFGADETVILQTCVSGIWSDCQ